MANDDALQPQKTLETGRGGIWNQNKKAKNTLRNFIDGSQFFFGGGVLNERTSK